VLLLLALSTVVCVGRTEEQKQVLGSLSGTLAAGEPSRDGFRFRNTGVGRTKVLCLRDI
jgi:hypothetical protein